MANLVSTTSLLAAQKVESLPSVEENSVEEISNNNNIPLEYLSLKLVKETFGRVLSDQALQLEKERSACAEADECLVTGTDEIIENCTNTNEIGNQNFISSPDKSPQSSPTQTDHLYSSSSTHLCAKLTETLHSTADVGAATEPAAENPVSLSGSMSKTEGAKVSLGSSVESSVESVINDNIKILGRNFQSQHDLSDFSSVQDQGHAILENELRLSKDKELIAKSSKSIHDRSSFTSKELTYDTSNAQITANSIAKLEAEVESYKAELGKIRPDGHVVALQCNTLDIDPAIATVPHLLDLLKSARNQNTVLQDEVKNITDKLYQTTHLLEQQKKLFNDLKMKMKSIDTEDARRRKSYVSEISKFYETKIRNIESELVEKGVHLEADFWIPHCDTSSIHDFVSIVMEHKDEVAEEELRRDLSNAGTDKFSDDDEPIVFPVQGFRESITFTQAEQFKYLEDDESANRPKTHKPPARADNNKTSVRARTCALQ